jgi:hypothetical protein
LTSNAVRLQSTGSAGLYIQDANGNDKVLVVSKSMYAVGSETDLVGNDDFEEGTGALSPGRNLSPTVPSWSMSFGGHATASLTNRAGYADIDKAVSGDYTLDVIVPSESANYASNNTYDITQVITGSFTASNVLSFKGTCRFSHSLGGLGYNRNLEEQLFRVEYLVGSTWTPFLPNSTRTGSDGFGFYRMGQSQYASFGGSAVIPYTTSHVRIHLSGSVNSDATASFTVSQNLSDPENSLKYKTYTYQDSPKYPETELTFDSFDLKESIPRVELIPDGLLIYNSEDSYIRMTTDGIDIRGGSGYSIFGSSVSSNAVSNDMRVAGNLDAPSLQGSSEFPNAISTSSVSGISADYSRYDHIHDLPFSTLDSVIGEGTVTNLDVANLTFSGSSFKVTGSLAVSSSVDSYFIGGGGVGIGTSNATTTLQVRATNPTVSIISDVAGYGQLIFGDASDNVEAGFNYDSNTQKLYMRGYNNSDVVTIDNAGLIGIGTTIPGALLHVVGDAIFTGTVTAQEFHAEFVSSSIIYESGSTKFGDSLDDYHDFTGSLNVSGSTHHFFGDVGIGTTNPNATLTVTGNTTLTGSLGISNTIKAPNIGTGVDNSVIVLEADGTFGTDEIDSRV